MRSIIKKRAEGGFTLIEVLVALGIAAGSLVLILSANGASLKKSVRARLDERLVRAAESKLAELRTGAERATEGSLSGFDLHRWEIQTSREEVSPLRRLERLAFRVVGPSGEKFLEWAELRHESEKLP
jgi:prepilin-type N-terminal cleavage/methylation domain-containing protein